MLIDHGVKVVKTDALINVEWVRKCGESEHFFISASQTRDGGCIISGFERIPGPVLDYTAWIVKVDANGNVEWDFKYKPEGRNSKALSILECDDGGYVFTAHGVAPISRRCPALSLQVKVLPATFGSSK
ncbi:MAG: hypothetical protein QXZ68_05295 [Candidatus Bathyarchaeia archaeon]